MRRLASFLLLGVALAAGAAATEVWRWKDANGVVHYSDSPMPGAERVQLDTAPPAGAAARVAPPAAQASGPQPEPERTVRYTRCAVTDPARDQTFRLGETISAALAIEPDLQPGHRIQVNLNNAAYPDWPETSTAFLLNGLFRGTYTLSARVLDANNRVLCSGPSISFNILQSSILSPARQPPKKN